jgi:hypothetical protein
MLHTAQHGVGINAVPDATHKGPISETTASSKHSWIATRPQRAVSWIPRWTLWVRPSAATQRPPRRTGPQRTLASQAGRKHLHHSTSSEAFTRGQPGPRRGKHLHGHASLIRPPPWNGLAGGPSQAYTPSVAPPGLCPVLPRPHGRYSGRLDLDVPCHPCAPGRAAACGDISARWQQSADPVPQRRTCRSR